MSNEQESLAKNSSIFNSKLFWFASLAGFSLSTFMAYSNFRTVVPEEIKKRIPVHKTESDGRSDIISNVNYKLYLNLKKPQNADLCKKFV
jgi:hypothetical protein